MKPSLIKFNGKLYIRYKCQDFMKNKALVADKYWLKLAGPGTKIGSSNQG